MKGKTGGSLGSTTFKERTEEERPDGDPAWRWVAQDQSGMARRW